MTTIKPCAALIRRPVVVKKIANQWPYSSRHIDPPDIDLGYSYQVRQTYVLPVPDHEFNNYHEHPPLNASNSGAWDYLKRKTYPSHQLSAAHLRHWTTTFDDQVDADKFAASLTNLDYCQRCKRPSTSCSVFKSVRSCAIE